MITDKIENIYLYSDIPQKVKDFILNIKPDLPIGRVVLSDDIYVNIETYQTKPVSEAKFEAHKKYIDIQIVASGKEKIAYTCKHNLTENKPYNLEKDIVFYKEPVNGCPEVCLDGTNFVMLLPHEAHAPQICEDNLPAEVKKIVVKIRV